MRKKLIILGLFTSFAFLFPTAFAYSDVNEQTLYSQAINYLNTLGVVKGYDDGSFRPQATVNRAEFLKMIIEANQQGASFSPQPGDCFSDVKADQWFSKYICYAKEQSIVSGFPDGSFRPANPINIAEAAKMLTQTLDIPVTISEDANWYSPYIAALAEQSYIPASIQYLNANLKRAEVAEIIWRALEQVHSETSTTAATLENSFCNILPEDLPANIDMAKVRDTWLGWYNAARADQSLSAYTYNPQLNRSAIIWSEHAEDLGSISHKRPGQTAYYDYQIIKDWFANLGLEFKNVESVTFTENIGWGYYQCSAADCTESLNNAIRTTFDFFMSEKNKSYRPHYNSIMNKYFKEIGLGIAVDPKANKYYLTVHYGTEIISHPPPICP